MLNLRNSLTKRSYAKRSGSDGSDVVGSGVRGRFATESVSAFAETGARPGDFTKRVMDVCLRFGLLVIFLPVRLVCGVLV